MAVSCGVHGCGRAGFDLSRLADSGRSDGSVSTEDSAADGSVWSPMARDGSVTSMDGGSPATDASRSDGSGMPDGTIDRDSAAMEAGTTLGGCPMDDNGIIVCDDFASGELSSWETSGSPTLTSGPPPPAVGDNALSLSYVTGSAGAYLTRRGFMVVDGFLTARAFVYVASDVTFNWADLIVIGTEGEPFGGISVGLADPSGLVLFNELTDRTFEPTTDVLPRDQWFCLQLEIEVDDSAGQVRLLVDGMVVAEQRSTDTLPSPGYEIVNFGFELVDRPQSEMTIFFDSVAVGTVPLPCTN